MIVSVSGYIPYLFGRYDYPIVLCFVIVLVLTVVILGAVVFMLVRTGVCWRRSPRSRALVRLGLGVFMIIATGITIHSYPPAYLPFSEGFRERMLAEADIEAIRAWNANLSERSGFMDEGLWPACVKELSPRYVLFTDNGEAVKLIFGGGFDHWGIVVGPETMPVPETDRSEHTWKLAPGAYVFSDKG